MMKRMLTTLAALSLAVCPMLASGDCHEADKLINPDPPTRGIRFGRVFAVSGDTVAIAEGQSVFVFTHGAVGSWTQQAELSAPDVGTGDDGFGLAIAVNGDTAVIGAPGDEHAGPLTGSAHIFTRDASGSWTVQATVTASDASSWDLFGHSVAVDGDTAVLGAPGEFGGLGWAYVFTRDGSGNWTEQAKLAPSDAEAKDAFGHSVALRGDTAVIASPGGAVHSGGPFGAAYVFTRDGAGSWTEQAKLTVSNRTEFNRAFGVSLAFSGDTAIIGGSDSEQGGRIFGSARFFTRDGSGSWRQQAMLTDSDTASGGGLGGPMASDGDVVVIGSPGDNDACPEDPNCISGAVYVFRRNSSGSWVEQAKLTASDAARYDGFGGAVALSGDLAFIGSPSVDGADNVGALYVYDLLSPCLPDPDTGIGADTDSDGVQDVDDGCPTDPAKSDPGVCGCGEDDVDSDDDGVFDCDDECPGTRAGVPVDPAGCELADSDLDGVPDESDGCPTDPAKSDPGVCGCGEDDVDSDDDGVFDCDDECPGTRVGAFFVDSVGCELPDSDSDGVPDVYDGCPYDETKPDPGYCGCGVADVDSDGDGALDCWDACPGTQAGASVDADGCEVAPPDDGTAGPDNPPQGSEQPDDPAQQPATSPCGVGTVQAMLPTMLILSLACCSRRRRS